MANLNFHKNVTKNEKIHLKVKQKKTIKSALVIKSKLVSSVLVINRKQRPISFFETFETAQISSKNF